MDALERVLSFLEAGREPVSGQELADKLGVSRTAVWKQIQKLRRLGYEISGSPKRGYRLNSSPDIILCGRLEAELPPDFRGRVICRDEVVSTNDVAKELAAAGELKPGGLVVAESQTGGRGRFGRRWLSPRGGIWMSLVLRPRIPAVAGSRTALLAAVCVAETIAELTGLPAKIKWPNDILINGRKVSGILIEMAAELGLVEYLVVGIGINANFRAAELANADPDATTLMESTGRPVDRTSLAANISRRIFEGQTLLQDGFESVINRWKQLSDTLGRDIAIETGGKIVRGRALDVDSDGALIVRTAAGKTQVFRAGEVTVKGKE